MTDRIELLEATLESLPEGVGLLDEDSLAVFWNPAAEAITGYGATEMIGKAAPEDLRRLLDGLNLGGNPDALDGMEPRHGTLVHVRHKLGHEISAMARHLVLRNGTGRRVGMAVLFHPAECLDALPQGEPSESEDFAASQEDLKQHLDSLFEDFAHGGPGFGVLWITVDQAHTLRRTHGTGACETMLKKLAHALGNGLRPAEQLGRWGEDEFLVISHERTQELLAVHAQVLTGLARTADFRWWGDRISLTVSVGAAQAEADGTLVHLLERARKAMASSFHGGGNRMTRAPEGHTCSPS